MFKRFLVSLFFVSQFFAQSVHAFDIWQLRAILDALSKGGRVLITHNRQVIPSGLKTEVVKEATLGEKTIYKFTLSNIGKKSVRISNLSISGSKNFRLIHRLSAYQTLMPGQSVDFFIQLRTSYPGQYKTTVKFWATSGFQLMHSFNLIVNVKRPPTLELLDGSAPVANNSTINLGTVASGYVTQKTFAVKNSGDKDLVINSLTTIGTGFRIAQNLPKNTFAPGESGQFTVEFASGAQAGLNAGVLEISSNAKTSLFRVNLQATVSGGRLAVIDAELDDQGAEPSESYIQNNPSRSNGFIYLGGGQQGSGDIAKIFRLKNIGSGPLEVTSVKNIAQSDPNHKISAQLIPRQRGGGVAPLSIPPESLRLAPGETADIRVVAEPIYNWLQTGYIEILSNSSEGAFTFNVAAAVSGARDLICSSDSNNWVEDGFSCSGKPDGTICGANANEQTKVCNQGQCLLMGDANNDGFVDGRDVDSFVADISQARSLLALDFNCDGDLNTITPEVQGFANALVDSSDADTRGYNSRIVGKCSARDLNNDPTRGRGLAFINGPFNFAAMKASEPDGIIKKSTPIIYNEPVEVCLDNLGTYDAEGNYVGGNGGFASGKFTQSGVAPLNIPSQGIGRFGAFVSQSNDFRFSPFGGDGLNNPREAVMRFGALQMYHDVNALRSTLYNDQFFKSLNLSSDILSNLTKRQGRTNLIFQSPLVPSKPVVVTSEALDVAGITLNPANNFMRVGTRFRGAGSSINYSELPPFSHAFDTSFAAGDFVGLMFFWITNNFDYRTYTEAFFGDDTDWKSNVMPAVNDGLSAWTGYRLTGDSEVYKNSDFLGRIWSEFGSCLEGIIPCDRGQKIDNVMMFDPSTLRSTVVNPRTVFPFQKPSGGIIFNSEKRYDGPQGSDLSGLYFAALFYDIAHEAGLGLKRADMLFWKAISLIDSPNLLSVNEFGIKILSAAKELFPAPGNDESIFEPELRSVLLSRGITLDDNLDIENQLPDSVGGFKSPNPNYQPGPNEYGMSVLRSGSYSSPSASDVSSMVIQFMKHSKVGPCDVLRISDGTFSESGSYNNNGTYLKEFTGRELHNKFVRVVGGKFNWVSIASRCPNEFEGYYSEDLTALGFRAVSIIDDGFIPLLAVSGNKLKFSIEDGLGSHSYKWSISQPGKQSEIIEASSGVIQIDKFLPIRVQVERSDGATVRLSSSITDLKNSK